MGLHWLTEPASRIRRREQVDGGRSLPEHPTLRPRDAEHAVWRLHHGWFRRGEPPAGLFEVGNGGGPTGSREHLGR
jgi:hypothetical protein